MSNNNFGNVFNSFQSSQQGGQNGQTPQQLQQQHQQLLQMMQQHNSNSGSNAGNVNLDMIRAMMQQLQSGQLNTGVQQQQQPPPQPQQQQQPSSQYLATMQMGMGNRPPGMMQQQNGMTNTALMVGPQQNNQTNLGNMQQGGAISGAQAAAQAAAAASQAAAMSRQQQQQQTHQGQPFHQQSQPQIASGPPRNIMGVDCNANGAPATIQEAIEMARAGTLSAIQAQQLRAIVESRAQFNMQNSANAGAVPPSLQQQQQPQQQQHQHQHQHPQQQRLQMTQQAQQMHQMNAMMGQQRLPASSVAGQTSSQANNQQQQAPGPAQTQAVAGQQPLRPPANVNPMQVFKMLHERVADLQGRVASTTDAEQRAVLENQLNDSRRALELITTRLSAAMQMQQQQRQHQQQQQQQQQTQSTSQMQSAQQNHASAQTQGQVPGNSIRPPTPQATQQRTPQSQPRPSPRPSPAGVFGTPTFAQQQQHQQQFATLNQSPHLQPAANVQATQNASQQMGRPMAMPNMMTLRPDQFIKALNDLMVKRNQPISSAPMIANQSIDLYKFYQAVQAAGGSMSVHEKNLWPHIAVAIGLAASGSEKSFHLSNDVAMAYRAYLGPFEEAWQRASQQTMQMNLAGANRPRPMPAGQQQQLPASQQAPSQQMSQGNSAAFGPNRPPQSSVPPPAPTSASVPATITVNGQQITLPPAPILTAEQLSARRMTQEQFANQFRLSQLQKIQQAQQQRNGDQQQQQQQMPQFQQPFGNNQQNAPQGLVPQPQAGALMASAQQYGQIAAQASQQPAQAPQQQGQHPQITQNQLPSNWPSRQLQEQGFQAMANAQREHAAKLADIARKSGKEPDPFIEPEFMYVEERQIEEAKVVIGKIDQELNRARPRMPIQTDMPEAEKESILDEIKKLSWVLDTVNALLPVFFAMQGSLEPTKRVKIMAYMFKDQQDLLPQKECNLRREELEKCKLIMSRSIHHTRTRNPIVSNYVIEKHKREAEARQRATLVVQQQQQPSGSHPQMQQNVAHQQHLMQQQQQYQQQQQQQQHQQQIQMQLQQQQHQYQQQLNAQSAQQNGSNTDTVGPHGIKRGLRVEDLKQPPVKRGKGGNTPGAAQNYPQTTNVDTLVTSSPLATAASPSTAPTTVTTATTPAASIAKGKRGATKATKGKKSSTAATTPKLKAKGTPDQSIDDRMDVSSPNRIKTEAQQSESVNISKTEAELDALTKEMELAKKDPAEFVEKAWQELLSSDVPNNAATMVQADGDVKSLESILTMLGQQQQQQQNYKGATQPISNGNFSTIDSQTSRQGADEDISVEIDLFDFIDAEAMAPDVSSPSVDDPQMELDQILAANTIATTSSSSEALGDTPDLIDSSRASSSTTSSTLNGKLHGASFEVAGTPWSTTSPIGEASNHQENAQGEENATNSPHATTKAETYPEVLARLTNSSIPIQLGWSHSKGVDLVAQDQNQMQHYDETWWDTVHEEPTSAPQPWAILS